MPQIPVNSVNIVSFGFSASIDLYLKKILFQTSPFTQYTSGGAELVQGISFQIKDQNGVLYHDFNFSDPDIVPADGSTWEFDWSAFGLPFMLGNTLIITGGIKDQDGQIYYTQPVYKKLCKPNALNESGYVTGTFQIIPNCTSNVLTVKELTLLVYNKETPSSVTKDGNLYYPTGAGVTVPFTGTPFSNNLIISGQSRIENTTVATYDLGDDIYVQVTYLTKANFNITCSNFMGEVACCLTQNQQIAIANCGNAIGENARQKTYEILPALSIGLLKQINGEDSSAEAAFIKKTLNCDCGVTSLVQNEMTPTSLAGENIVLVGAGATNVPSPSVSGDTKTYTITSPNFLVSKEVSGDLAYTITADTSVTNQVNWKIKFNYDKQALYNLNAIAANPTLVTLLNSLITGSGNQNIIVNGKCIFSSGSSFDYVFTLDNIPTSGTFATIGVLVVDGVSHDMGNFSFNMTNLSALQTHLNTLGYGTFVVDAIEANTITISSTANTNTIDGLIYSGASDPAGVYADMTKTPNGFVPKSISSVVQLIIDYLCALTSCKIALCQALSLYRFDYNGEITSTNFGTSQSQNDYNVGVQDAINSLVIRIDELTGITCAKIAAIFSDRPLSVLAGAGRAYGLDQDGNCTAFTQQQMGISVMQAIAAFPDVKALFCAIDCTVPGDCPDIVNTSLAMSGANIGVYGLSWITTPSGSQTVTVMYKLSASPTWITATNSLVILPNGNISGTTPFLITGVTAGQTYDVKIINNCGGVGFSKQITTPTGTVYPGSYRRDTIIYDICGSSPVTLYSSAPFAIGIIMYTDTALTTPLTGYNFIAGIDGEIYTIDNATGEVLDDTASNCEVGMSGNYILANTTVDICSLGIPSVLYTSGAFGVGKVLYTDSGLTNPRSGYSFVVNIANNHIYNLNSVTGQIGSDTGLTCSSYGADFRLDNSDASICGQSVTTLYSSVPFAPGVTMYTDSGLTTPVTGFAFIESEGSVYNLNVVSGVVGIFDSSCA